VFHYNKKMIDKITEKGIESAQKFLENICLPVSKEFGLMLKDQVRMWRLNNIVRIINKSQGRFEFEGDELTLKANPRVVSELIEKCSWQDQDEIQDLWAGLLNSSISENEHNDSNLIFISLLNQLTANQARIIKYFAESSKKTKDLNGRLATESGIIMSAEEFCEIAKCSDINLLTAEIEHLKSLGLVESGMGLASGFFEETTYDKEEGKTVKTGNYNTGLKLSPLSLSLFIRCQGHRGSLLTFIF